MSEKKFASIMFTKAQTLCDSIKKYYNINYEEALDMLYHSKIYEVMEDEKTKMWYYSNYDLFNMFLEEKQTGTFTINGG